MMCAATGKIAQRNNCTSVFARLRAHVAVPLGKRGSTRPPAAPSLRKNCSGCGQAPEPREFHAAAGVGSIIVFTSVIFVAGKPLTSAFLRMMASTFAMQTQEGVDM